MDDHIVRCGIIGSCQSAATSEIIKALLVTYSCKKRNSKYRTFTIFLPFLQHKTIIITVIIIEEFNVAFTPRTMPVMCQTR